MDDTGAVGGVECVRHLDGELDNVVDRHLAGGHVLAQSLPVKQLHNEEGSTIVLADVVNRADEGVVEGRGDLSLALESFQGGLVLRHLVGQKLERHLPAETSVLGTPDDPHAATTEVANDLVVRDGFADHGATRRSRSGLEPFYIAEECLVDSTSPEKARLKVQAHAPGAMAAG